MAKTKNYSFSLVSLNVETDSEGNTTQTDLPLKAGGTWIEGISKKHFVYTEGSYLGYPTVDTTDHLAPQDSGSPSGSVDTSAFPTASDTSVVSMTQLITITQTCYTVELQVMAPFWDTDSVTKVTIVNITQGTATIIDNPILTPGEFTTLSVGATFLFAGDQVSITFDFYNSTAASAIDGGWTSSVGLGVPTSQAFNIDNVTTPTVIEISHTDLDSGDRSTELDGVTSGSIIRLNEKADVGRNIEFIVDTVNTVSATSTLYTVLPGSVVNGAFDIRNARTCSVHIDVPISQPSTYGVKTGFYPAGNPDWGTITTELRFSGVLQPATLDGYPINLVCQPATISQDWFYMAVSGGSGGGGAPQGLQSVLDTGSSATGLSNDFLIEGSNASNFIKFEPNGSFSSSSGGGGIDHTFNAFAGQIDGSASTPSHSMAYYLADVMWMQQSNIGGNNCAWNMGSGNGFLIGTDADNLEGATARLDVIGDARIRTLTLNASPTREIVSDDNGYLFYRPAGNVIIDKNASFNFDIPSNNKTYTYYNAGANNATVNTGALSIGGECELTQLENGVVTILAGAGANVIGKTATAGQFDVVTIKRLNDNGYGQTGEVYLCS